ncbi:MAG TPA: MBL fold metallo-hydrolase [Syntrophales bacterium]|nr:MBL fold metallo-hydrolase [Syntrophales bacterium]HOM06578.1 MBL fold metallo-hydrolase [Syntrophales bacterium]HPQ06160.1 MBL fold metallo-hydrolase [Syntrophales bacterium]
MELHFWGSRGSLPAPLTAEKVRKKIAAAVRAARDRELRSETDIERFLDGALPFAARGTYGGNTSCVEIRGVGQDYFLCDAGTGLRDFGHRAASKGPATFHIFLSHPHWDHIQGFPFFTPAYGKGNKILIYGLHPDLGAIFETQQRTPFFPVPLKAMAAEISFITLEAGRTYEIGPLTVTTLKQVHPGDSYGYSFVHGGKKVVYSTDAEHKDEDRAFSAAYLEFVSKADLLVFDAQYTYVDAVGPKENWGHSNNITGVEMAVHSGIKRLCLFHSEHTFDDEELDKILADAREYLKIFAPHCPLVIDLAYDGLTIEA